MGLKEQLSDAETRKERQTCNGSLRYHPCRHGAGSAKKPCILPELNLDDGFFWHPMRAAWAEKVLDQGGVAGT